MVAYAWAVNVKNDSEIVRALPTFTFTFQVIAWEYEYQNLSFGQQLLILVCWSCYLIIHANINFSHHALLPQIVRTVCVVSGQIFLHQARELLMILVCLCTTYSLHGREKAIQLGSYEDEISRPSNLSLSSSLFCCMSLW